MTSHPKSSACKKIFPTVFSWVSSILPSDWESLARSRFRRSTSDSRLRRNSPQKTSCWFEKSMMFCSIRVNSVARNLWNSLLLLVIWLLDLRIGKILESVKSEKFQKRVW